MENVLITGANKGIGLEIVKELLKKTRYKIIGVSKNVQNLEYLKRSYQDKLEVVKCNLLNIDDLNNLMSIIDIFHVDILINNAGIGYFDYIENISDEILHNLVNLNLIIPFKLVKKVLPGMKSKNYGHIINIGSNADSIPEEKNSLYCATKFGLKGFSQCLRLEIRGYNISISTISPGRVDTFFNNKKEGDRPTALKAKDVSKVVSFILDSCSNYCIDQVSLSSLLE